jgi:hypothetical protein
VHKGHLCPFSVTPADFAAACAALRFAYNHVRQTGRVRLIAVGIQGSGSLPEYMHEAKRTQTRFKVTAGFVWVYVSTAPAHFRTRETSRCGVFQKGAKTEVLARFSTVASEQGSADTWSDVCGL